MATTKKSESSSSPKQENANGNLISLDWWAVIFALALAVIVYVGLQVTW